MTGKKKEEKTWLIPFDSCCACCAWRAGSILPVYEETAAAGYRAYTDDGDGKNWLQKIWMPDIRKLRKRLLNCLEESTSVL